MILSDREIRAALVRESGSSIQLEIWNFGPVSVVLKPGMKVCQLIFETVDATPDMGYTGKFAIQGPAD